MVPHHVRLKHFTSCFIRPVNFLVSIADVAGDVCRSVFQKIAAMAPNERFDLYGGAVFIIGVVQALDLLGSRTASDGGRDAYLSLVPVDHAGCEIRSEAKRYASTPC
jgi:hypothetical protein